MTAVPGYHRVLFRIGQALGELPGTGARPLRSRAALLARALRVRQHVQPGLIVVQKDARSDGMDLWIAAFLEDAPCEALEVEVELSPATSAAPTEQAAPRRLTARLEWFAFGEPELSITHWKATDRFFHGHLIVNGLDPGRRYEVRAVLSRGDGALTATCSAKTLPRELSVGTSIRVFAASCYDVDTDEQNELDRAFSAEFGEGLPDMTWLMGDAAYLDAPWWMYATLARRTPRRYYLQKYWTAWGMQRHLDGRARPGLGGLLRSGPNWFLPDDHEFWNNWPHKTVTARHSWVNISKGLGGAASRSRPGAQLPGSGDLATDPHQPPDSGQPKEQNFLPVHPDEWESWSRGAFDLFGSFQTRSRRDRERGLITRGARDDGDDDRPPTVLRDGMHEPLNQLLQIIDVPPVRVALLDTRTRRVPKHRHPTRSTFVDEQVLQEMLAAAQEAEVFVLVLAQPALKAPKHLARGRWLPEILDVSTDRGIEDYWHQYFRFWDGLLRARAGRPTLTVGGDIHRSYVALAESISLVEVVASPMSQVAGVEALGRLKQSRNERDEYAPGSTLVRIDDLRRPPRSRTAQLVDPMGRRGGGTDGPGATAHVVTALPPAARGSGRCA